MVDFMPVDQGRAWPEYKSIGQGRHICVSRLVFGYAGTTRIFIEECRHMIRYVGLTFLIYCAGAGDAGLPDLLRSLVWHIGPGYGQRSYPGYRSQLRCHVPTIKERFCQVWRGIMLTGCTVVVYLPSLCTSTALTSEW
jgi:hypothetical protein